jgi:hypothetical protein
MDDLIDWRDYMEQSIYGMSDGIQLPFERERLRSTQEIYNRSKSRAILGISQDYDRIMSISVRALSHDSIKTMKIMTDYGDNYYGSYS